MQISKDSVLFDTKEAILVHTTNQGPPKATADCSSVSTCMGFYMGITFSKGRLMPAAGHRLCWDSEHKQVCESPPLENSFCEHYRMYPTFKWNCNSWYFSFRYASKLRYQSLLHAKQLSPHVVQLSPYEHISIANGSSWRYHVTLGYHFEEQWYEIVLCFPIFITTVWKYTERCLLQSLGKGSHFEHSTSCSQPHRHEKLGGASECS